MDKEFKILPDGSIEENFDWVRSHPGEDDNTLERRYLQTDLKKNIENIESHRKTDISDKSG